MPEFHVNKSIAIDAPRSVVYPLIRDFQKWPTWSPWLLAEPECGLTYAEDGRSYEWAGDIVGSGRMELLVEVPNKVLDYTLTFLKPFKSENKTTFTLEKNDGGTLLTWTMTGSLPWFMFWMKGMMAAYIGMDYARGLAMLKDLAETGAVSSKLDFLGDQSFSGLPYVGIRNECPIDRIGEVMSADLKKLKSWQEEAGMPQDGRVVSIYHKWNVTKGVVVYTVAVEVPSPPASLPEGMSAGAIPDTRVYAVRHTGPYHHLGNAWSAGMMHAQSKLFRQNKKLPPFELYENDPSQTPEADLQTLVQFPVK